MEQQSSPDNVNSSETTESITTRLTTIRNKWYIWSHALSFFIAVFLSIIIIIVAIIMLLFQFFDKSNTPCTPWPETMISFIMGIWISDRPKFIKKDNNSSRTRQTTTRHGGYDSHNHPL